MVRRVVLVLAFAFGACAAPGGPNEHGLVFGDAGSDGVAVSDGGDAPRDASNDASNDVSDDGADGAQEAGDTCTSNVAVVGGTATALFTAVSLPAPWTTRTPPGSLAAAPAIAPFGTGFHAVLHEADDSLRWSAFDSAWSTPAPLGGGGAAQSYGARAASAASIGGKLVLAQVGGNAHVYAQTWDASWQPAVDATGPFDAATGPGLQDVPPVVVPLSGGAGDAMIVFLHAGDFTLMSTVRTGSGWSAPLLVDKNAYTNAPVSVVPLSGGRAVLAWRGADGMAYFSLFGGTSWGAPSPFLTPNVAVFAAPALAPGVCGVEALAALAEPTEVSVLGLVGSTWTAAYPAIPASAGVTFVAMATRP